MRLVTLGLESIQVYLDGAIDSDDYPIHYGPTQATLFCATTPSSLRISRDKYRIRAARVDSLGHVFAADGVLPNAYRVVALSRTPMPTDIKQLASLIGDLSYYRKFLLDIDPRSCPIAALFEEVATFDFPSVMEDTGHALPAEITAPSILVFPD